MKFTKVQKRFIGEFEINHQKKQINLNSLAALSTIQKLYQ
jgi:hypothetical protein